MAIIVKGGGGKPEEEKTVTAGTSVIEVNPSSGKVMKKVTVNPTPTESKSVTPTTSELTVTPSEGKHLSQVVVGAVEDVTPEVTAQTPVITQILEGLVGKAQGANATADKILEGYSAYVGQELLHGTAKEGMPPELLGCTKYAVDKFTYSENTQASTVEIVHSLGEIPKYAFIIPSSVDVASLTYIGYVLSGSFIGTPTSAYAILETIANNGNVGSVDCYGTYSANTVLIKASYYYLSGVEYTLITMA